VKKALITSLSAVGFVLSTTVIADQEFSLWVECTDRHSKVFGLDLDRRSAAKCLSDKINEQFKTLDIQYVDVSQSGGPKIDDKEFRASLIDVEKNKRRADAILGINLNSLESVTVSKKAFEVSGEPSTKIDIPIVKGYRNVSGKE